MPRAKRHIEVVPQGPPTPERAFEAFCQEHGYSGVLIWSEQSCEPGARPVAGSHVCMLQADKLATPTSIAAHRGAMAYQCALRLRDFQHWLDSLLAGRVLR